MTVDELLKRRDLDSFLSEWKSISEGMSEEDRTAFLAQTLELAADAARSEIKSARMGQRAAFQIHAMQLARAAAREAMKRGEEWTHELIT